MNCMQFDHITRDTSQGPWRAAGIEVLFVVRCGICFSNSLSNSMEGNERMGKQCRKR